MPVDTKQRNISKIKEFLVFAEENSLSEIEESRGYNRISATHSGFKSVDEVRKILFNIYESVDQLAQIKLEQCTAGLLRDVSANSNLLRGSILGLKNFEIGGWGTVDAQISAFINKLDQSSKGFKSAVDALEFSVKGDEIPEDKTSITNPELKKAAISQVKKFLKDFQRNRFAEIRKRAGFEEIARNFGEYIGLFEDVIGRVQKDVDWLEGVTLEKFTTKSLDALSYATEDYVGFLEGLNLQKFSREDGAGSVISLLMSLTTYGGDLRDSINGLVEEGLGHGGESAGLGRSNADLLNQKNSLLDDIARLSREKEVGEIEAEKAKEVRISFKQMTAEEGIELYSKHYKKKAESIGCRAYLWLAFAGSFAALSLATGYYFYCEGLHLEAQGHSADIFSASSSDSTLSSLTILIGFFREVFLKLFLLGLPLSIAVWAGRNYRALAHQNSVYDERKIAANVFWTFYASSKDDAALRGIISIEAAHTVFSSSNSGFLDQKTAGDSHSPNLSPHSNRLAGGVTGKSSDG